MKDLIVWHNLNKDTYYYKFISNIIPRYRIGDKNQYNHEVVLIIPRSEVTPIIYKVSLLSTLISPIKWFLTKLLRLLDKVE